MTRLQLLIIIIRKEITIFVNQKKKKKVTRSLITATYLRCQALEQIKVGTYCVFWCISKTRPK